MTTPPTSSEFDVDLLIVGGGPAGLTAATEAASIGRSVLLVEASERLGGMSASLEVGGQRVDLGSHRLHPSASSEVMEILRRVLGDDLQTRPRNGRIRLAGKWLGFPLQPLDLITSTPPSFGAKAALDMLTKPLRRQRSDTYDEVVRTGLGPTVLKSFYGPYATKLWGIEAAEIAGDVARRRISVRGPVALVKKLLSNASKAPSFLYPRLGYGQVVDGLVAEIHQSALADISTGTSVTQILSDEDGVEVALSDGRKLWVRRVLWTAAPHQLAAVVVDAPGDLAVPKHRGMVLVYLVLDSDQYTPFDAHYFPELSTKSARISEPKNYRTGPDQDGTTVLCSEIVCDPGDDVWNADTETLKRWVMQDLVAAELPTPDVVDVHVERLPAVYPVITPDDEAGLAALACWAQTVDRVHVFGRQGLVVADNLHHVMDMAVGAVSCLVEKPEDDLFNERRWSELQAEFAQHVVED